MFWPIWWPSSGYFLA